MPFTPFHFGPAIFFGLLLFRYVGFPTFLIANVIVDAEPFFVLAFGLEYPLHGFFHSFLGGSLVAIALSAVMIRMDKIIQKTTETFGLKQEFSKRKIFPAAFSGIYVHILLDSSLPYPDIKPFYPLDFNPFYGTFSGFIIYALSALLFFAGLALYGYKLAKKQ